MRGGFTGWLPPGLRKHRAIISDAFQDSDGCWVYLKAGWQGDDYGLHIYHEDTWEDIIDAFSPTHCNCRDCRNCIAKKGAKK